MPLLSRLAARARTRAVAGFAVAGLAAGFTVGGVLAAHGTSAHQVVLTGDSTSSDTDTSTTDTTTSTTSTETSSSTTETSSTTVVDTSSTSSGTTTSTHGDAVTSAVSACKAERSTGGPKPPSGKSHMGIGQCVAAVARSQSSGSTTSGS